MDGKRCLEGSPDQHVLLREVEIEPHVNLECVAMFCYLHDAFGASGAEKASRARVSVGWQNSRNYLTNQWPEVNDIQSLCQKIERMMMR